MSFNLLIVVVFIAKFLFLNLAMLTIYVASPLKKIDFF